MSKTKVTSKAQVTNPQDVRDRLGLRPGDEIDFVEDRSGIRGEKCLDESLFAKYRGYLRDLEGREPDELVEEMRGR